MSEGGEVELVCTDFNAALDRLRAGGFRLDLIYPADEPHTAVLAGGGSTLRLTSRPEAQRPSASLPPFVPEFVLTRAGADAGEGRAGMSYRDLIPGRLGGRYIASQITIREGGEVADWVHFHRIALQLIFVARGWVKVVYEDQGDPFVMEAGDLVLQPPGIRHRVLEGSPGLEVIEISCPALHETFADHEMQLPNGLREDRDFGGQRFLWHRAAVAPWTRFDGGEAQETGVADATGGIAEVRVIRSAGADHIAFEPHPGELVFGYALDGSAALDFGNGPELRSGDAFVIPPDQAFRLVRPSNDFRLLQVLTARLGTSF